MKNEVYFGIALRIVVIFVVGMMWTYVPGELRDFFGDQLSSERTGFGVDRGYKWGARHYWYAWMMFLLFVLSVISAVMQCAKLIGKHHPEF